MEFGLVIKLEIIVVDIGYWTKPCRKLSNSIWVSQEINSYQR